MAIIDILTHYDAKKKAAHAAKTVKHGVSVKISAPLATDCSSCCSAVCRCKHDETKAAQAWPRGLKAFLSNHHLLPDDVNHMARLIAAACSLMSLSFKDCSYNYYRFVWHSHRGNRFCVWFSLKVFFFFTLEMRVAVYFIICVTSSKSCLFIFLFPGGGRDLDSEPGAVLQTILRVHVQHLIVNIIFQSSQLVSPCHRSVRCHAHAHTDTHVSLLPHLSVGQSPIVKTKPPLLSISLLHYPDSTCEPLSLNLVPGILPVVFFLKKQTNK